ncbi:hypothetical protein [Turneriella parva]|uniref:Uncharacterized protein n=1 Tax=Turneriella parva (strain ATCC BAA-1111 / DSM 21527 / NCTC 11395 / H) TaxID=869212 RepID=I4B4B0_TURPD|nr:hypothetical protein [Turneriella parva]AFM12117.1 hypothetical protein Turpa_1469 [Turneriella parva DSM 21527]
MAIAFHEVMAEIKSYDHAGKVMIKEYCESLLADEARAEFAREVEEGMQEFAADRLKAHTSVKDLRASLDAD